MFLHRIITYVKLKLWIKMKKLQKNQGKSNRTEINKIIIMFVLSIMSVLSNIPLLRSHTQTKIKQRKCTQMVLSYFDYTDLYCVFFMLDFNNLSLPLVLQGSLIWLINIPFKSLYMFLMNNYEEKYAIWSNHEKGVHAFCPWCIVIETLRQQHLISLYFNIGKCLV